MSMNKIQMPSPLLEGLQDVNFLGSIFADTEQRFNDLDYAPAFLDTQSYLTKVHKEYFASAVTPIGDGWAPITQGTALRKGHAQILIDTTDLMQSVLDPKHESHIGEILDRGMTFGTVDEKAEWHQYGFGEKGDKKYMPSREFLGIDEDKATVIVERLIDEAVAALVYHR